MFGIELCVFAFEHILFLRARVSLGQDRRSLISTAHNWKHSIRVFLKRR